MRDEKPLSDNQIGDRLFAAAAHLDGAEGKTIRGNSALRTARAALAAIQAALVEAGEKAKRRPKTLPERPRD